MAIEALELALTSREKEQQPIPKSSKPGEIIPDPDSFLVVIKFDILAYKKRTNSRAVKKSLNIPKWMNEAVVAMNLNFSQVLQEALLSKIQS